MGRVNCVWPGGRSRRFLAYWAALILRANASRRSMRQTALSLAKLHLENLNEYDGGRNPRIVDKMPDNYMYVGLLAIMFPKAVFMHSRRDLRDIAVSCWMTDFRSIRWANDQSSYRQAVPAVPSRDESLERSAAGSDSRGELRRDRDRPRVGGAAADRGVRPSLGAGLPRVSSHRAARAHGQRHASPPAGLPAVGRSLETLRAGSLQRTVRAACRAEGRPSATDSWSHREEFVHLGDDLTMFQTVGQNAETQCFNFGDRIILGLPIHEDAGEVGDFCDPPPVFFAIQHDPEAHSFVSGSRFVRSKDQTYFGPDFILY